MSKDYGLGECAVTFCDNPAKTKGLCQTHRRQQKDGKPFTQIKKFKTAVIEGISNFRHCTWCSEVKKLDEFYVRTNGGYSANCKRCMILRNRAANCVRLYGEQDSRTVAAKKAAQEARNGA